MVGFNITTTLECYQDDLVKFSSSYSFQNLLTSYQEPTCPPSHVNGVQKDSIDQYWVFEEHVQGLTSENLNKIGPLFTEL